MDSTWPRPQRRGDAGAGAPRRLSAGALMALCVGAHTRGGRASVPPDARRPPLALGVLFAGLAAILAGRRVSPTRYRTIHGRPRSGSLALVGCWPRWGYSGRRRWTRVRLNPSTTSLTWPQLVAGGDPGGAGGGLAGRAGPTGGGVGAMTPAIVFERVSGHPTRVRLSPTIIDVDLEVPEGELCVVVGPTGSGKSTLLGAINGLVPHFTGGTLRARWSWRDA
ncbi:MAG: ATP-binding cassette domain-containing protein [Microthrixaceae bacterium]|nr:ATP-binding cassette domain-containing protein [Microthrixaceae bacterium]